MKIPFLFGIHCHQPADNFYHVVDWAIKESYEPFIDVAMKNKNFKFSAHYSGWLLEYIRSHRGDLFKNLKTLSEEGRIEFFVGGFYEPILSAIPSDDRRGQVEMHKKYIKNYFGQDAESLWLTERVWDPAIIPDMHEVGIKNIVVDDYHLLAAGFPKESITGYFTTEQDGCPMNLFPIDMGLRYLTPFKPESEVVDYIIEAKNRNVKLITCFDDGEKFGLWPNTYDWVYKKGWLKKFIKAINSSKEIEIMHYKDALNTVKPSGHIYLPITSYAEMGEWSLFADKATRFEEMRKFLETTEFKDDIDQFVKGSVWKNFFVKYPESNRLHKRTVDLSIRARKFKGNEQFKNLLYKSQCNDSLWHGVFGGLYLPNLRTNAWKPLIQAEEMYEDLTKIKLPVVEQPRDLDRNGYNEVYVRGKRTNLLFESRDFGQLTAIELKDKGFNLLNVISRKKEAYHEKLLKNVVPAEEKKDTQTASIHEMEYSITPEQADRIINDWYNKNCFVDHFIESFDMDSFEKCKFREYSDFANQPADSVVVNQNTITFKKEGGIYKSDKVNKTTMEKTFTIDGDTINFDIKAKSSQYANCIYSTEFNFHFADLSQITINDESYTDKAYLITDKLVIFDKYTNKTIAITFKNKIELLFFTLYTVSQSEMGIDLTAQGITVAVAEPYKKELHFEGSLTIKEV